MKKPVKSILASLSMVAAMGAFAPNANAAIAWIISPDSNASAFGVTVVDGLAQINSPDSPAGTQPVGIFGAGFTMTGTDFSMKFDSDLYTWDAYNAPTGAGTGWWDAFVVSVSTAGFYWDVPQLDPVPTGPNSWVWGGTNFADGILESYTTAPGSTDMISMSTGTTLSTFYVSLVLDTKTAPNFDTQHPSYGSFHVAPVVSTIPEPETYAMLLAGLGLVGFTARRRKTNV